MRRLDNFVPPLTEAERALVLALHEAGLTVEEVLLILVNRRVQAFGDDLAPQEPGHTITESDADNSGGEREPQTISEPLNGSEGEGV